jgi:hypothetical protein
LAKQTATGDAVASTTLYLSVQHAPPNLPLH